MLNIKGGNYQKAYEQIAQFKLGCEQEYYEHRSGVDNKKVDALTMEQFCIASFCQAIVLLAMNQWSKAAKKLQYVIVNSKNHKHIQQAKILIKFKQHAKFLLFMVDPIFYSKTGRI